MNSEDTHPLHAAIDAKLAEISAAAPVPPSWHDAWSALGPQATDEERLAVYRDVRDAGSVPSEAGFFLIAWMLDVLTDARAEDGLREAEARLESVRQEYGLAEDTPTEDAPAAYREAMQQSHDAWDRLYVATMEEFGEHQMARLFQDDPEQFDERYETGRQFFHGPDGDEEELDWLDGLLQAVSACVEVTSAMGPLGYRYREEDGFWEIWIFPTPVELVGGAHDGAVVAPDFSLDLEEPRSFFESVEALGWHALGLNWSEGPHVYVEGVYEGHEVYLKVLAQAPEGEEPGIKVNTVRKPQEPG